MSAHFNLMCKHLPFTWGVLCGFAAACILVFIHNIKSEPIHISKLLSMSSKRSDRQKIIGYLKRDSEGVNIYESFHRAWSEGGSVLINIVDDQSESMAYVKVIGVGEHVFNRNSPPVYGIFTGGFQRENKVPNCCGLLQITSVEFLPDDPSLYKEYISK